MNYKIIALIVIGIVFLFETWMEYLNSQSTKREIPENVKDVYDEEAYTKWMNYDRDKNRLSFISHVSMYLFIFVLIGFDGYARIISWLGVSGPYESAVAVTMADLLISMLYAVPISYVNNMIIEQKYGFNRMTKKTFVIDRIKEFIINGFISCALVIIFAITHLLLGDWLLVVFTIIMLIVILLAMVLAPVFSRIYNKFEPLPEGNLRNRLTELLENNGCTVRAIDVVDGSKRSSKANAYFVGFGKVKKIVLYDTLLEQMSEDEIVAVFAHEVGHNKHKDTLVMYGLNVINIAMFVVFAWALAKWDVIYTSFGFSEVNYGFAFILLSNVCMALVAPLFHLFVNFVIRKREYAADRFAAENGYGKELITALKTLSKNSFVCLNPHPLVVNITYSHPTLSQRIAAIEKFEQESK